MTTRSTGEICKYGEQDVADPVYLPVTPSIVEAEGLVAGYTMLPHVQAYVDAVSAATGEQSFGTYIGHDPTVDRAVDQFTPVSSRTLGDAICDFAIANMDRYGIWYIIYRQHIYNPEIGRYWRLMEDRGSPTQNHMDHVHASFYATVTNQPPEDDMFSDADRKTLAEVNEVLNNTEVGVLRRVADVESGIQNIFLTFQRIETTLARIEQHQNQLPPPQ